MLERQTADGKARDDQGRQLPVDAPLRVYLHDLLLKLPRACDGESQQRQGKILPYVLNLAGWEVEASIKKMEEASRQFFRGGCRSDRNSVTNHGWTECVHAIEEHIQAVGGATTGEMEGKTEDKAAADGALPFRLRSGRHGGRHGSPALLHALVPRP